VILQTLASLAILAVTAAPGRVFERRADKRAPRHYRSSFAEYVELVIVGAILTLVAVMAVVLVAGLLHRVFSWDLLDIGELLNHPGKYAKAEPWRIVIGSVAAIALSFAFAFFLPKVLIKEPGEKEGMSYYEHSAWLRYFLEHKPAGRRIAVAAQFKDGYKAVGILTAFTPTQVDDRELVLQKVQVNAKGQPPVHFATDNFLIIRESQISWMIGEYVAKSDPDPPDFTAG
jgi:hypothetical protein